MTHAVKETNEKLSEDQDWTDRKLSLSVDLSRRFTWESRLAAHLNDLPIQFVGRGEQNSLKTMMAIGRHTTDAQIVLIEEPENRQSFSSLRKLISKVESRCADKQAIIATHSSFVLNKLAS